MFILHAIRITQRKYYLPYEMFLRQPAVISTKNEQTHETCMTQFLSQQGFPRSVAAGDRAADLSQLTIGRNVLPREWYFIE